MIEITEELQTTRKKREKKMVRTQGSQRIVSHWHMQ